MSPALSTSFPSLQTAARLPALPLLFSDAARATGEVAALLPAAPWLATAPRGDGHAVLVLPGFGAGDLFTAPMRHFLRARGFDAHGWKHGPNWGRWDALEAIVVPEIERLHALSGAPVSVIGASMGGLYARAAAHVVPDKIRCVVTFGSAAGGPHRSNYVWPLFEAVTAQSADMMSVPPPLVPSTSVFSRSDGLADWQPCVQEDGDFTENIEVVSSHLGMISHPASLYLAADRLAQAPGAWAPFTPPAAARLLYRQQQRRRQA
jgi:pimeloyl-ACP methyl ester carboxylesterase